MVLGSIHQLLRGRVARKFNDKPNWNRGKDARFPAQGQRNG